MGCFSSKHTMTVTTTTTNTTSSTYNGRTVADVSTTTHTTPSRGKPTTTHDNYQTVTYHGMQAVAQPVPGVVRDSNLPPPTPLELYIRPSWTYNAIMSGKFWEAMADDIRRKPQNPKRNWTLERVDDNNVVYTNGLARSDPIPVVKIATYAPPKKPKRFSKKKEPEPSMCRWTWADDGTGDKNAIRLCGEANGISQLTEPEFAVEDAFAFEPLSPILHAAARATDLPFFVVSPFDPKTRAPQDVYLVRVDDQTPFSFPGRWRWPPTLKDIDGDTYRGIMRQGRVVRAGVLERHGGMAPECLQALAEKMGWEFYDLGSWHTESEGVEHIGMRDPKMDAEWTMRSEYEIVNAKRSTSFLITYKVPGSTYEYTRSFEEW